MALLLLTLLCGVGSLRVWSGQGWDLVMRGASNVRINRRGAMRRMREVLVVTMDRSHRIVDIQFGHCVTVGAWVKCI